MKQGGLPPTPIIDGKSLKKCEVFTNINHMLYQFTAVGTAGLYQMESPFSVYPLENLMNFFSVLHYLNMYKLRLSLGCNKNIWEFLSLTEARVKEYWLYSGV